ncbi:MAG: transposase [Gammaproteobacteria bacterium]|nr:transposase [Gammaproteobacteria bacterium]
MDSQLFVSQSKAQGLARAYQDSDSVVSNRYVEASEQDKPTMAQSMMERAIDNGLQARYLVADAWFGSKRMIRTALALDVCPIFRMKRGKMKYRVVGDKGRRTD